MIWELWLCFGILDIRSILVSKTFRFIQSWNNNEMDLIQDYYKCYRQQSLSKACFYLSSLVVILSSWSFNLIISLLKAFFHNIIWIIMGKGYFRIFEYLWHYTKSYLSAMQLNKSSQSIFFLTKAFFVK